MRLRVSVFCVCCKPVMRWMECQVNKATQFTHAIFDALFVSLPDATFVASKLAARENGLYWSFCACA